ncbi:hypothetical protein MKX01_018429 [Papaver californicum]|nr:hypothetical protein MKX01_018429 [Papaver californicum]
MAKQKTEADSNKSNRKKKVTSKKLQSGPNTVFMKYKAPLDNPFETLWSRRKFDVMGKKRKGEEKRLGLSRSRAIEKRKDTLLKEYRQSGKSSVFLDNRIGEKNNELGEFDKALLRFQRERQLKVNKKNKYNLSDGEEGDNEFHGAGAFPERDDFEDDIPLDNEADETKKFSVQLGAHNAQFESGLGREDSGKKSKKEVMEEVMLKSKYFKAQKAKDKEEDEELLKKLDDEFAASRSLLEMTQPGKRNALNALKGNSRQSLEKDKLTASTKREPIQQERPDEYDKLVKGMALERRGRPSDRTKTPEEIAQEDRERLEQLEEKRQKRMDGTDDSGDEDSDDDLEDSNKTSSQKLRSISGDDLGDSFSVDEEVGHKRGWVDDILQREGRTIEDDDSASSEEADGDGEESEEEAGSDEVNVKTGKSNSLKDWEQSDDGDDLSIDSDEDNDDEGEETEGNEEMEICVKPKTKNQIANLSTVNKTEPSVNQPHTKQEPLPFVIEAPKTFSELSKLLENRSDVEIIEAINRIRACNGVRLAAENREKMQIFYANLLMYFATLPVKKPLNFKLLNLLVKPLVEMSMDIPFYAAVCARERLRRTRELFCKDITNPEKSCWPSFKTLCLLRLWSITFPCSDFRHAVMTPAMLLMCEYLMRCPITSGRDIVIGSFLCSMVLSIARQSKKFYPEALIFLRTVLISALKSGKKLPSNLQVSYLSELKMLKPWLCSRDNVSEVHTLDFLVVIDNTDDSPFFGSDNFRASVLVSVMEILQGFVEVYEGYNSFPEIFMPISTLLNEVSKQNHIPSQLQDKINDVTKLIETKVDEYHLLRQPLQMRKKRLEPIKLLNPKFEDNYVKGRDYDPDRERSEMKKLRKRLKREEKGAASELRKDNKYLAEAKLKALAVEKQERAEKVGKTMAFLQEQQHAFNSGVLGGKGKRRR